MPTLPALSPASPTDVVLTTVAIYLVLLIVVRIAGTRSLATMAATDLACVVAVGAVVGRTALLAVPTLENGVIALVILFAMQFVLTLLRRSRALGAVLAHRPFVLVCDGRIDATALRRSRVSEDDLRQRLRQAGLTHRGQVRLAVLERNGKISVLRDEPDPWLTADLRQRD